MRNKCTVYSISTVIFFFSSRRRHTRCSRDWSSDVCSSDLDLVVVSIGEVPITDWLPENLSRVKEHWLAVDEFGRTRDPRVFAVGDVVKPGLLTEAIGQGRIAALALHAEVMGEAFELPHKQAIPQERLNLIYFTPRLNQCPTDPLSE